MQPVRPIAAIRLGTQHTILPGLRSFDKYQFTELWEANYFYRNSETGEEWKTDWLVSPGGYRPWQPDDVGRQVGERLRLSLSDRMPLSRVSAILVHEGTHLYQFRVLRMESPWKYDIGGFRKTFEYGLEEMAWKNELEFVNHLLKLKWIERGDPAFVKVMSAVADEQGRWSWAKFNELMDVDRDEESEDVGPYGIYEEIVGRKSAGYVLSRVKVVDPYDAAREMTLTPSQLEELWEDEREIGPLRPGEW